MFEITNKKINIELLNNYMFTKTLSMFEWFNLPDTIPQRELEKLLQVNGFAFITEVDGDLYAFAGGLGGECDAYGNPTQITISNTFLKFNKTLNLKTDGVLISNDDLKLGLKTFFDKQSTLLVENDINLNLYGKNTRIQTLISAPDNITKQSAEEYLKRIDEGRTAVIGENKLFDGIKVHSSNSGTGGGIKDLLEYHQYLKSNLYTEVGLSSNFNMKRERLLSAEIDQSEDSLFPLVYNMMQCRLIAVEQINAMFNTIINIDFGSVWHYKNKKLVDGVLENDDAQSKLVETDNTDYPVSNGESEETKEPEQELEPEPVTEQAPEQAPEQEPTPALDLVPVVEIEEITEDEDEVK